MKKILLFGFLFMFLSSTFAQKLSVLIDYKSYYVPVNQSYLEISSFVNGKTVVYSPNKEGKYQAEVRITVKAYKEDELVNILDFIIVSEAFEDSIKTTKPDFGDIQNMPLPNGEYFVQFSVQDMFAKSNPVSYASIISIDFSNEMASISDISLYKEVSRTPSGDIFDKYGFSLKPLFYGYVPDNIYNLYFSCEIYNTNLLVGDETIIIKSYITYFENNLMPYPEAFYFTHSKAKPVVVTIGEIGIYKLPSGNYNLVVDVLSKDSVLLSTNSYFFQRSNPRLTLNISDFDSFNVYNTFVDKMNDSEQLLEYVKCLYPIATPVEKDFYIRNMSSISIESLKKFFYAFWVKRDPYNPEKAWLEYLAQVNHVNREFGSKLKSGYLTDRGRVYLQYGAPNSIYESPFDSHSYPYEIWHYYYCVDQSNVKFVFYNTDLVSKDYELLHSDKRGEFQDPFWKLKLTQRKTPIYNFEDLTPEDYFGGNPKDDWMNHR